MAKTPTKTRAPQTVSCPCGRHHVFAKRLYVVNEIERQSGFRSLLSHGGGRTYLCPDCWSQAAELAQRLLALVGDTDIYLPGLLKKD